MMRSKSALSRVFNYRKVCLAVATCFATGTGFAARIGELPSGAVVTAGVATLAQSGNNLTITNSNGAIINWQTFSIGNGGRVEFIQPGATSSVLNRVVTATPSELLGTLASNGRVFLINPAGILVGAGAQIDVAGFVASTLQFSDADFLAGRFLFSETPGAGTVRNEGHIRTHQGGSVYLIGPKVINAGTVATPGGETILAAGQRVELGDTATPGVRVEVSGEGEAGNMGAIVADAGRIGLVGALVRNSGTLNASGAVEEGGKIFLRATRTAEHTASGRIEANGVSGGRVTMESDDVTRVSGEISATGSAGSGGSVQLLGDKVGVTGEAVVDASGSTGGGSILVGGDYQGKNPDVRNAAVSHFGADATLKADATANGNGGKVIVWANDTTRAYGKIFARGGENGGDGGFVETSGHRALDFKGTVNTSAANGKNGMLLLDPGDVTIYNGTDDSYGNTYSGAPGDIFYGGGQNSWINWNTLVSQLANGTSLTITTDAVAGNGDIAFQTGSYSYNSTSALSFLANRNISFSTGATLENTGTGAIKMMAGWNGLYAGSAAASGAAGSLFMGQGARIRTLGEVDIRARNNIVVDATAPGGTVEITGGGSYQRIEAGGYVKAWAGIGGQAMINYTGNGLQTVKGASGIEVKADNSGTNDNYWASITSSGDQTIETAGAVSVTGGGYMAAPGSGNYAEIRATGHQHIHADQISLYAGNGNASAHDNSARLVQSGAGGSQTLDFNTAGAGTLTLTGGAGGYGSYAAIEATGNQSILNSGGGTLDITLNGGSSSATGKALYTEPGMGGIQLCPDCGTLNDVRIDSYANQSIQASSVTLTGGSNGVGNRATIQAEGTQSITTSGAISLTGGASGGAFFSGHGVDGMVGNEANIGSETAQTINSGNISLIGGGNATSHSGAFLTAPSQTISAGNITLTGGASNATTFEGAPYFAPGMASAAVIGWDGVSHLSLTASGAFSMSAGTGSGGSVLIGSLRDSANLDIYAQSFSASGSTATIAGIGNGNGLANNNLIQITATAGGIALNDDTHLLGGANGNVTLTASGGAITQGTTGTRLVANTLEANASAGIALDGPENNVTGTTRLTTTAGNITLNANEMTTHVAQATTGNGNIALTTQGDNKNLALGHINAGTGTVNVGPSGAILDDNGDGVVNITAGTILLSTADGNSGGGIAVSADVVTNGSVSATVPVGAGDGGIRIHSLGASAPTSLTLSDATLTGAGDIFFAHDGNLTANANYMLNSASGSVLFSASGNLTMNGASFSAPGGLSLTAGEDLTLSSLSAPTTLFAFAGKTLTVNGSFNNQASGDVSLAAPTISVPGLVSTDNLSVSATTLNVSGTMEAKYKALFAADDIVINGGTLRTDTENLMLLATGNVRMNGGTISAGNDVEIELAGADSMLYLNDFSGIPTPSVINSAANAGSAGLIYVDYLARSAGGCVIDGVPSFATTAGASGFFTHGTPAALGSGLMVSYSGTVLTDLLLNDLLSSDPDGSNSGSGTPTGTVPTLPSSPTTGEPTMTSGDSNNNEFGGGTATSQNGAGNNGNKNRQTRSMCR